MPMNEKHDPHTGQKTTHMPNKLVIVESPAKAKTIEGFLGEGYTVTSSMGHVRDLKKKGMGVDVENSFEPDYEISPDKVALVAKLKSAAKKADMVLLASDEDREGESIAWHLYNVLGLNEGNYERIVFHEITKTAITHAVENPRKIDFNLVNAQQARRVLDRIVGFMISPILWRKVKPGLSAGRVQSVTVRLIVDRENEIQNFHSEASYKVSAVFTVSDTTGKTSEMKTELSKELKTKEEALAFLECCKTAVFSVAAVEKKPLTRRPAPPFTTSTLQQEANRKLGFSVRRTMSVAQSLYESGKITYMRTDSVNLSQLALKACEEEIKKMAGEKYVHIHNYHTTAKGAQEAHEAIRPTYISNHQISGTADEVKLYNLIWKRTVASQMVDAQIEHTTININVSGSEYAFQAKGSVVVFDGFLRLYMESQDDAQEDDEHLLPALHAGQQLQRPDNIEAHQRYSGAPMRYSEASLVKELEKLGIGRPSTYAPTISTIMDRDYVRKEDVKGIDRECNPLSLKNGAISDQTKKEAWGAERNKLVPTDIGKVVNSFLLKNFSEIMDYNFTADEEKRFDEIAEGNKQWNEVIRQFYTPFEKQVEAVEQLSGPKEGERQVGVEASTGKPVFVKIGRFGPVAQIGSAQDEEKPRFASLRKDQHIDTITFEEVMDLFKLPRTLGEYEGKEVVANVGRFGPYVKFDGAYVGLKGDDPMEVTLERAVELIEEKRETERNRVIKNFEEEDIQVLNGRFGPYIASNGVNYKIPKGTDAHSLTIDDCKELIKAQPERAAKKATARGTANKAASKTAATKKKTTSKTTKKTTDSKGKTTTAATSDKQ